MKDCHIKTMAALPDVKELVKVEWFDKPQPMQNTKHYSSKMLEAIAFEVHLTSIFPPYTDSQSLEATLA